MNIHRIYAVLSRPFRRSRMRDFLAWFAVDEATTIVDVGGTPSIWMGLAVRPHVLLVNLDVGAEPSGSTQFEFRAGDGRNLDFIDDGAFDVAFSNSVVEHVGGWADQQAFARELRRIAKRYYVQTPAWGFPIEPHLMAPFAHWLPRRIQGWVARYVSIWGWVERPTPKEVDAFLDGTRMLRYREVVALFPDSRIIRERVLGLTKSYIAVGGAVREEMDRPSRCRTTSA